VPALRGALALGLPPTEAAYVRGLLAPTVPEAVAAMQEAARLDPFHLRTSEALVPMLILLGRLDEARDALARMQLVVPPDSLSGVSYDACLRALAGDLAGAEAVCERLRARLGEDGVAVTRSLARLVYTLSREELLWDPGALRNRVLADVLDFAPRLARLVGDPVADPGALARTFALFRLPCFGGLAQHPLLRAAQNDPLRILMGPRPGEMADLCATVTRVCPNGTFHWMEANWLLAAGREAEAEAAYCRAVTAPSLLPVRRLALYELTVMQARHALFLPPGPARESVEATARRNLRELARHEAYPASAYLNLTTAAKAVRDPLLALTFAEAWARREPDDLQAHLSLVSSQSTVGAHMAAAATCDRWLARHPNDPTMIHQRASAELNARDFSRAAATLLEVALLNPDDPILRTRLLLLASTVATEEATLPLLSAKLRLWRPLVLARRGAPVCAVAAALDAVREPEPAGETLVALACVHVRAAVAARVGGAAEAADAYAAEALALLGRAEALGYFSHGGLAAAARFDPDLAPLRDCPGWPKALGGR
jgi:Flp pilus assembly protein TadD